MSLARPKISFVIASRNDHWCGDSLHRLMETLCHLRKHFPDSEVILVDWGSERRLVEYIKADRTKGRVIYVPPSITSLYGSQLCETVALNCGIRRSCGQYIARLDQDILPGLKFRSWLSELPDTGVSPAFFSERREMAPEADLANNHRRWSDPPWADDCEFFYRAAVGVLLARADDWFALRGYDERLRYRNHMEHDLCARFSRTCGLVNLGPIVDYDFFHQWHCQPPATAKSNPLPSPWDLGEVGLDVNDDSWGLGSVKLEERFL